MNKNRSLSISQDQILKYTPPPGTVQILRQKFMNTVKFRVLDDNEIKDENKIKTYVSSTMLLDQVNSIKMKVGDFVATDQQYGSFSEIVKLNNMDEIYIKLTGNHEQQKNRLIHIPKRDNFMVRYCLMNHPKRAKIIEIMKSYNDNLHKLKFYPSESSLLSILFNLFESGVSHLDIKPDNIVLDSNGKIILIDWDFAIKTDDLNSDTGYKLGAIAYAPKRYESSLDYDIYSIGKMIAQTLDKDYNQHDDLRLKGILYTHRREFIGLMDNDPEIRVTTFYQLWENHLKGQDQ